MKKVILAGAFVFVSQVLLAQVVKFVDDACTRTQTKTRSGNNSLVFKMGKGRLFAKNSLSFPVNGDYLTLSDRRLKTNISPLPTLLERILRLEPVEYEMQYDNPSHKRTIGFIAQDVKKLFPELVSITSEPTGGYKGITDLHAIRYSGFAVLAIKAIQEQQQLIQELRREVNDLKAMMAR